jgi:hypothetical protein
MSEASAMQARRGERGEVSWVGLVLLLGAAAVVYAAFAWVPVYIRMQQVDEIVRGQVNLAVHEPDDARLVADLVRRIRALDTVEVETAEGRTERVARIDLSPRDVVWERNPEKRNLHIAFSYSLEAEYPWIHRVQPYTVEVDRTADISLPDWGSK